MRGMRKASIVFILILPFAIALCSDCNDRGKCGEDGRCTCIVNNTPFTQDGMETCLSVIEISNTQLEWNICRAILAAMYFSLSLISGLGLYYEHEKKKSQKMYSNLFSSSKIVLGCEVIGTFILFLDYAIDPSGYLHLVSYDFIVWLDLLPSPFLMTAFLALLFHWMDLHQYSARTLKERQMLAKVRSDLDLDVSLDQVIERVNFLRKLKFPFIGISVLTFVLTIICAITRITRDPGINKLFEAIYALYMLLFCLSVSIGFLIYRRRLAHLIPPQLSKKVSRVSSKMIGISISIIVLYVLLFLVTLQSLMQPNESALLTSIDRKSYAWVLIVIIASQIVVFVGTLIYILIFVKIELRKFPFCLIGRAIDSKSSQRSLNASSTELPSLATRSSIELPDIPKEDRDAISIQVQQGYEMQTPSVQSPSNQT
eukprot:TRINITY_DN12647_c0_g1_i1.p1 TRINITY_DN12647_c0_g1~~TRINITY_DN12647_c0_g1_i1.p1  ORF type:complete len:428 (-),score=47.81 TRINITY_DN12647_c0_g1_i1:15-1298(-)